MHHLGQYPWYWWNMSALKYSILCMFIGPKSYHALATLVMRYVRYTRRWRKKCTVLHRIQWRIWWCTEFGDKFSTDFFTVLKKAYFSMTILSLNSVMIYWRLIHHWIRWWKLVYFLLWLFWSPNSVHMFALKLMKMILVKILATNLVKNYVLHWIPWQIKNTSHAHNVFF